MTFRYVTQSFRIVSFSRILHFFRVFMHHHRKFYLNLQLLIAHKPNA